MFLENDIGRSRILYWMHFESKEKMISQFFFFFFFYKEDNKYQRAIKKVMRGGWGILEPHEFCFSLTFLFQFFKQGPAYKNEWPDPNKGSNQQ